MNEDMYEDMLAFIKAVSHRANAFVRFREERKRLRIIRENRLVFTSEEVAAKLGLTTYHAINARARKLGLQKRLGHWRFNEEEVERLKNYGKR